MIPILFDANSTEFSSNGIGRLSDCTYCLVTEERNGIYEAEFQYPITGLHYDMIEQGRIVLVSHDEQQDKQPFVIYRISKPINGIITVNAHHISYKLSGVIVSPFTASNVTDAFDGFVAHSLTDNPFTFWTDKASDGSFKVEAPTSCKRLLGGVKGSILDSFGGGEYEWDNYTVKLYAHRGSDNGVTIRYGKNLANIDQTVDTLDLYNAVIPYWSDGETTVVYGGIVSGDGGIKQSAVWTNENNIPITNENGNVFDFKYYVSQVTTMDLSSDFENPPTVAELEARALAVLNSNQPWIPKENIKVDFVALWQTEEYADVAPLERVRLCDTVSVYYPDLGVQATAKVIKVVWDALTDRYDSIELGDAKTSFADVLQAETNEKLAEVPNISMMDKAIQHATDLITGGMGGHIVFLYDADGKPTDMLVMDTEDVNTAVHVLRINVNGIGFSSTGVSGTYASAWTLDGRFVADFITAGTMSANRIQGGTLSLGGTGDGNGVMVVYDASGTEIGRWSKDGINITKGSFSTTVSYHVAGQGIQSATLKYDEGRLFFIGGTSYRASIGLNPLLTPIEPGHQYGEDPRTAPLDIIVASGLNIQRSTQSYAFFRADSTDVYIYNLHTSSSSMRFKHDISDKISPENDAHKLYELAMKQFVYNDDHLLQYDDMKGKPLPGFIAEDVAEIYPSAVIHDGDGNVESWDERRIIPGMLELIQEQHDEIEELKERLNKLETIVDKLMR